MDGPIITDLIQSEDMVIEMNPFLLQAIGNKRITHIDLKLRSEIRGDINKALYRFLEGQRSDCYTIGIIKLSKVVKALMTSLAYGIKSGRLCVNWKFQDT